MRSLNAPDGLELCYIRQLLQLSLGGNSENSKEQALQGWCRGAFLRRLYSDVNSKLSERNQIDLFLLPDH